MGESRKEFVKTGVEALAAMTAAERLQEWRTTRTVLGASDRVRVGIVGLRGSGAEHIRRFGALPNIEIAALCDIDDSLIEQHLQGVQKMGFHPKTYIDIRKLLDDKSIDAVSINTPNHWHALMAI
jgi:predicted dehydrogenase